MSDTTLHLVVPGEPVPKARARTFYDPRARRTVSKTPVRTAEAEQRIRDYLKAAYPALRVSEGRFRVLLAFHMKGVGRGDSDNLSKTVLDALQGAVWRNDRQVRELHVYLRDHCPNPRTEITVSLSESASVAAGAGASGAASEPSSAHPPLQGDSGARTGTIR